MRIAILAFIYLFISVVCAQDCATRNHPVAKCALYLEYCGGGPNFEAVVTDPTGALYPTGTPISYRCGQNNLGLDIPYQLCIECPPTSGATFTGTLTDTSTSTTIFTQSITCPTGGNQDILTCVNPPTYSINAFQTFNLKFTVSTHTFTVSKTSGDPHFGGFRGQSFDFLGEKNKVFQIFSDQYSSVNALFEDPTHNTHKHSTYMTAFGIKFADLTLEIFSNQTAGQIYANGVQITLSPSVEIKLADCVFVLFKNDKHNTIQIQTNHQVFKLTYIYSPWNYLNFDMNVNHEDLLSFGGILGLTEHEDFDIDNYKNSDFIENSLLSVVSKYNKYTTAGLSCSQQDPVSTLSPGQINPSSKPLNGGVVHVSKLSETFTTTA